VALELLGGLVAEEFHAVAAPDERRPLRQQAFELDRANLRAVLFLLTALLGVLIVVELALHAINGAVEEVDRRPQQVVEILLEACLTQRRDQRVEDVGDSASDYIGFGQWPLVGLALEGTVTVKFELGEDMIGRR
jgi:hypothetical protein